MKRVLIILAIIAAFLILLLGSLGVWAYYHFIYTTPLDEQELEQLTPDWNLITKGRWSPWIDEDTDSPEWNPVASFNAWVESLPDDQRAWPLVTEANIKYEDYLIDDRYLNFAGTLPNDPQRWRLLKSWVHALEGNELTDIFIEAYNRPFMGTVFIQSTDPDTHAAMVKLGVQDDGWDPNPPTNPSLLDTFYTWLSENRQAARFLNARAAYELEKGNTEQFVIIVETIGNLARKGDEFPSYINSLVSSVIQTTQAEMISWALTVHPEQFNEAHLLRIRNSMRPANDLDHIWITETLYFCDTIRRMSDKGGKLIITVTNEFTGDGFFQTDLFDTPTNQPDSQLHASVQRPIFIYKQLLTSLRDDFTIPWDPTFSTNEFVQDQRKELGIFGYNLVSQLIPSLESATRSGHSYNQTYLGIDLALAAHIHKIRNGSFPNSIDELDEELNANDYLDMFSGKPLIYRLTETGPLIYSVSDNRIDDGGISRWITETAGPSGNEVTIRIPRYPNWYNIAEAMEVNQNAPESIADDWILFPIPVGDIAPLNDEELELLDRYQPDH